MNNLFSFFVVCMISTIGAAIVSILGSNAVREYSPANGPTVVAASAATFVILMFMLEIALRIYRRLLEVQKDLKKNAERQAKIMAKLGIPEE